jgi:hypothetical protein
MPADLIYLHGVGVGGALGPALALPKWVFAALPDRDLFPNAVGRHKSSGVFGLSHAITRLFT